jgi:hypothetical protein
MHGSTAPSRRAPPRAPAPTGPWLEELLTQSKDWEPSARQDLLRHIATLLQMRAGALSLKRA